MKLPHISVRAMLLAAGACALLALPQVAQADEACGVIAQAKYQQWQQQRIRRVRDLTMTDGSVKRDDMVLTQSTVYFWLHGRWYTGQLTLRDRGVVQPAKLEQRLSLADCAVAGHAREGGQASTLYTYNSRSDGFNAAFKMWIDDASGLPLRVDMRNDAPRGTQSTFISARYSYDGDVAIPRGAQLADVVRRNYWEDSARDIQSGRGIK